jgi:hypothetical protein
MSRRNRIAFEQMRTQHIVNAIQQSNDLFDRLDTNIQRTNRQNDILIIILIAILLLIVVKDIFYYYFCK